MLVPRDEGRKQHTPPASLTEGPLPPAAVFSTNVPFWRCFSRLRCSSSSICGDRFGRQRSGRHLMRGGRENGALLSGSRGQPRNGQQRTRAAQAPQPHSHVQVACTRRTLDRRASMSSSPRLRRRGFPLFISARSEGGLHVRKGRAGPERGGGRALSRPSENLCQLFSRVGEDKRKASHPLSWRLRSSLPRLFPALLSTPTTR